MTLSSSCCKQGDHTLSRQKMYSTTFFYNKKRGKQINWTPRNKHHIRINGAHTRENQENNNMLKTDVIQGTERGQDRKQNLDLWQCHEQHNREREESWQPMNQCSLLPLLHKLFPFAPSILNQTLSLFRCWFQELLNL